METITLGGTDLRVSELCLGTMMFGSRDAEDKSVDLLERYVAAGGNFIDTANVYAHWIEGCGGGESEALLGRWLKARGNRDSLVIASKVGFNYSEAPMDSSPQRIADECDKSLKRLGIETIDLYYLHRDNRDTPLEAQLEALDKLVRAGKVRYVAASNFRAWRLEEARCISQTRGYPAFRCVQQSYTYVMPKAGADFGVLTATNEDLLDYCHERQLPLVAYTPLLKGYYTREDRPLPPQYDHSGTPARLAALHKVAGETGATANQVVFAWMRAHDIIPIIAASTAAQIEENLQAAEVQLSADQLRILDEAGI